MFEAGPNLHPAAFKALDPAFVQILDVREQWEHDRARLPGAVLIPLGDYCGILKDPLYLGACPGNR